MAPHFSILAWKIPWTEEPGRLQSMGLRRVGHDNPRDGGAWWAAVYGVAQSGTWLKWLSSSSSSSIAGRFFTNWAATEGLMLCLNEVAQSCLILCDPMDCSLPGSSVHGIFQAKVLEWVAISFSRRSSQPRDRTQVSRIVGRGFTSEPPEK